MDQADLHICCLSTSYTHICIHVTHTYTYVTYTSGAVYIWSHVPYSSLWSYVVHFVNTVMVAKQDCALQQLQDGTDLHQVLIGLVEDGQLDASQNFAATLPKSYPVALVKDCERCGRLREAVEVVRRFKLHEVSMLVICFSLPCVQSKLGSSSRSGT